MTTCQKRFSFLPMRHTSPLVREARRKGVGKCPEIETLLTLCSSKWVFFLSSVVSHLPYHILIALDFSILHGQIDSENGFGMSQVALHFSLTFLFSILPLLLVTVFFFCFFSFILLFSSLSTTLFLVVLPSLLFVKGFASP